MQNKLLTIALPTRGRKDLLLKTLESIYQDDSDEFEVILKIDSDDIETIAFAESCKFKNFKFIISDRRNGWLNLNQYFNELIEASNSEWILGFNDDAIMETPNWFKQLKNQLVGDRIYFLNTNGYRESFPVYKKYLKELWGTICPHNQIDSFLYDVYRSLGLVIYVNDVKIFHDIGLKDKIFDEKMVYCEHNTFLRDSCDIRPYVFHLYEKLK